MMRKSGDLLKWMKTICLRCLGQLVILCAENRLRQSELGCRSLFVFVHPFSVGNQNSAWMSIDSHSRNPFSPQQGTPG